MEELENEKLLREIKPKFNFVYELLMPTGRKMKSALTMIVISIIVTMMVSFNKNALLDFSYDIIGNISLMDILLFFCYFMIAFAVIKLLVHYIFQKMQYEHISYKFYETYMVYEDDFLNQHKKNILYSNIKEVEVRRTIWDRLMGFGVIVIYTNAENKRNNGLVVYALNNPRDDYEFIDKLINRYKKSSRITNTDDTLKERKIEDSNVNNSYNNNNYQEKEDNILEKDLKKEQNKEAFKNSLKETN